MDESYECIRQRCDATKIAKICDEKGIDEFADHIEDSVRKSETATIYQYAYEKENDGEIKQ